MTAQLKEAVKLRTTAGVAAIKLLVTLVSVILILASTAEIEE